MNALTTQHNGPLVTQTEEELIRVLQNSLYPGANISSVQMVLGYCQAAGLDPMQKPVHIVPMWDGKAKQMRDVVMPGVNLYRTQASRTGKFAGMSEPEYGPMVEETLGGVTIKYPEWCRITVEKLLDNGNVAKFTAIEYWIENYAMKGGQEKSIAPNAMWTKRPRGQIAKCAEAQALRKAFPECGSQPTAEEMEGKSIGAEIDITPAEPTHKVSKDWLGRVEACGNTDELAGTWKEGVADIQKANDKDYYDRFKAAVARRKAELIAEAQPVAEDAPDAESVGAVDSGEANG